MTTGCAPGNVDTLYDDFSSGSLGSWWMVTGDAGALDLSGGTLQFDLVPNVSSPTGIVVYSTNNYDLTECEVRVEAVTMPTASDNHEAYFGVFANADNWLHFFQLNDELEVIAREGGAFTNSVFPTYVPATHRYWRIREASGKTYMETSADGSSWTTHVERNTPSFATAVDVRMGVSQDLAHDSPGIAVFDNLNIP
jgi:hypothetical protein